MKKKNNKETSIHIRVSKKEKKQIMSLSSKVHKSISQFIIDSCNVSNKNQFTNKQDDIERLTLETDLLTYIEEKYKEDIYIQNKVVELWEML